MKYFTSDWHLGDDRFDTFFRPFDNVEEQDSIIIEELLRYVTEDDELFHLGDVIVNKNSMSLLRDIPCKKVLILGNYDIDKEDVLSYFDEFYNSLKLTIGDTECFLNHYPVNYDPTRFNITGHVHGAWKIRWNMVNVGVDAWHFKPVSEEWIKFQYNGIFNHYDENVFI